jgi:SAM-dependent methyltransferase
MLTADVIAFVRAALPDPPARVLEIGAGDGALAAALAAASYDVVAIDPASETGAVRAVALHELDEPDASFDAAVAIVSLHHVEPLDESFERLAALVRPGGVLVVDEVDFDRFDERAARWWLDHADHQGDPAEMVAGVRGHMHSVARLREALAPHFPTSEPVRGPYLHRWNLPPGLHDAEVELIAAGDLPATGARLVSRRGGSGGG